MGIPDRTDRPRVEPAEAAGVNSGLMFAAWILLGLAIACIGAGVVCVNLDRRSLEQAVVRALRSQADTADRLGVTERQLEAAGEKLKAEEALLRRLRDFAGAPRGAVPPGSATP